MEVVERALVLDLAMALKLTARNDPGQACAETKCSVRKQGGDRRGHSSLKEPRAARTEGLHPNGDCSCTHRDLGRPSGPLCQLLKQEHHDLPIVLTYSAELPPKLQQPTSILSFAAPRNIIGGLALG